MKKSALICLFLLLHLFSASQSVTLDSTYAVRVETVPYSAPINYRGCTDSLFMKIYRPVNTFTDRPIVVLVHGGGWTSGTYDDASMQRLGIQLAARGYQAASIEYRLGHHIQPVINAGFSCLLVNGILGTPLDACMYPADTAEVFRAIYRGMQDTKTAIRFLKQQSIQDSTDVNSVYVIGESAGAFVTLQTAFMDSESEKPGFAGAIADAPAPVSFQCTWNNPCGANNLQRPDLGSVRGTEYLQESDEVLGVISLMGGMPNPGILQQNTYYPCLYFYHQSCDPIVPYQAGKLYPGVNGCMNDWAPGCFACPSITRVPFVKGGKYLYDSLAASGYPEQLQGDFLERGVPINQYYGCSPAATCGTLNPCPYCLNSQLNDCHTTFLPQPRIDSISHFLFSCTMAKVEEAPERRLCSVISPNPANQSAVFSISVDRSCSIEITVMNLQGETLFVQKEVINVGTNQVSINTSNLPAGIYFANITDGQSHESMRLAVMR